MSESEKALKYLAQLDVARSNDNWQDVSELVRKVEKHAPHRKCLVLTAKAEAEVVAYVGQRAKTPSSDPPSNLLLHMIPNLLGAIDQERTYLQDAFQATVCLGWIHWVLGEPGLAVAKLSADLAASIGQLTSQIGGEIAESTKVSFVRGVYIKGNSQEKTANVFEAIETYSSSLPFLAAFPNLQSGSSQFRKWAEQLLTRLCLVASQAARYGNLEQKVVAIGAFRVWARFTDGVPVQNATGLFETVSETSITRRSLWQAYYQCLSDILQQGLPYAHFIIDQHPGSQELLEKGDAVDDLATRLKQKAEIKRVEASYERLLMQETRFPQAGQRNVEIESWMDAVMANWRVLCGPRWDDEELGRGGKGAVGRGVLEILYRAATKTFHSTRLLRHLFTVHVSLAEFEIAFRAFDSYREIVSKAKVRSERSDKEEPGFDDGDTVLRTSAEAIITLCRFGTRREAEKARDIEKFVELWLEKYAGTASSSHSEPDGQSSGLEFERPERETISLATVSIAHRAIGISRARWAHLTYEASSRADIQAQAAASLRKALDPRIDDAFHVDTLYALGLLLAEMRDIPAATKVVKRALSTRPVSEYSTAPDGLISSTEKPSNPNSEHSLGRERKLIPVWHLLALLLTARSDFTTAAKACDAIIQPFLDQATLSGNDNQSTPFRSDHLNRARSQSFDEKREKRRTKSVMDRMGKFEKEALVQLKISHLSLIETLDGPAAAVDACDELLALYARLFGDPNVNGSKPLVRKTEFVPPKSATGTVRSIVGSVLGRSKHSHRRSQRQIPGIEQYLEEDSNVASRTTTLTSSGPAAPTIQVTNEDGTARTSTDRHVHLPFHRKDHTDQPQRQHSVLKKRSGGSLKKRRSSHPPLPITETVRKKHISADGHLDSLASNISSSSNIASGSLTDGPDTDARPDQPLRPIAHNVGHKKYPPPSGHPSQPPHQDTRLPVPLPFANDSQPIVPIFTKIQDRRHTISLLVQVWLFIAGLYTRAGSFEDGNEAIKEACTLVESFELQIGQESSSSRGFAQRGWVGGKSVDHLWADVWAERGSVSRAQLAPHEAISHFEKALEYFPDHPIATVGLSHLLLDIYTQAISYEPFEDSSTLPVSSLIAPHGADLTANHTTTRKQSTSDSAERQPSPEALSRLAARDRAYFMLSTLTKLGSGWDHSEAWYALARAHEESGQIEKAKDVLWWCVELEDSRPVRHWSTVNAGGFVL